MKRALEGNFLSPLPIVLVGALVNGKPNYLVIGYVCPFNFAKHVFFSLYKKRHTRAGILENRTFSVNVPTVELLDRLQIAGGKSGRDVDKSTLFDTFYGELETAPMIRECPISIECEVDQIIDYDPNEGIIGRVVCSHVDEECLIDGKLDLRKLDPLVWAIGGDFNYYRVGERIETD